MKDTGKLTLAPKKYGKGTIHNEVYLQPSLCALDAIVYKLRDTSTRDHSIHNKV